jgi:hypothetical protein
LPPAIDSGDPCPDASLPRPANEDEFSVQTAVPLAPLTVRSVIERHGGHLNIAQPTKATGLCCVIKLPLLAARAPAQSP